MECRPALNERACWTGFRTLGTGFLVEPTQNRHAAGSDDSAYILTALHIFFDSGGRRVPDQLQLITIQFEHANGAPAYKSVPTGIYVREGDDIALLRIPPTKRERLVLSPLPHGDAQKSITIGYTADSEIKRRYPEVWAGNPDEVHRNLSPGILRVVNLENNRYVTLRGDQKYTVLNTASLGRGNSGSPFFDLETASVAGMHNCSFSEIMKVAINASYISFLSDFSPSEVAERLPNSNETLLRQISWSDEYSYARTRAYA